jgi:putative membrane protein
MKLKLKTITYRGTPSCNQALALLVTLGTITTGSSLLANDHEGKYETRDSQSQRYAQEDVNAKTDPEKFICHVAQSGMKEIRLANLAKQRAQSQEVKQFAEKLIQDHTKANQELKLIAQHQNIPWDVTEEKTSAAASGTARGVGTVDTPAPIVSSEREIVRSTDRTPAEATATARGAGALDNSGTVVSSVNSTVDRETPAVANGTARGAYAANAQVRSAYADQDDTYDRLVGLTGKSFDEAYMSHEVQCHSKAVAKFEKASGDLPDGELKQFVVSTLPTLREHLAMAQRMAPADTSRLNIRERTDRNSSSDQDQANK